MKYYIHLVLLIGSVLMINNQATAQTSTPETEVVQYRIVDSIYSETLGESRDFWVRLPENFQANSDEKYAVVYLMDGFSLESTLEAVYGNYWGHYLPHMILVGISNREDRIRDLTTSQIKMRRGSAMDDETGGAETFTTFMEKELIPYIDSKYPTLNYRTLIGHSYAGLFTINMLINHQELFQNYIAIDPSLDWDGQKLLKQAEEKLSTESYEGKSLFVSLAAEQLHMWNSEITMENVMEDTSEFTLFPRSIIEFSNFVETHTESGLNFSWKVYKEDLHGTVPMPTMIDGLVFLFEWYQFKSPQKYNNPDTPVEELVLLLEEQGRIYSEHFGVPTPPMIDELLNGYGYMNLEMGQPEKAKMFFEMNIKYNPNNANAYDSMAEYYESQDDKENALKYLNKAYELSGDDFYKKRIEGLNKE
ncbi:MAG: alpha/beta hydrolase-fold protein [Flavobacteriaceae bacterium]